MAKISVIKSKTLNILTIFILAIITLLSGSLYNQVAQGADYDFYLGGMAAGFELNLKGVEVIGFNEVITKNGNVCPAKEAGVLVGDRILSINGNKINNGEDIENNVKNKESVMLEISRLKHNIYVSVSPKIDVLGEYKIGIVVKNKVCGIGTITYIQNNNFASLGHPISSSKEEVIEVEGGNLYNCKINSVIKGVKGRAGELKGSLNKNSQIGVIDRNTKSGVYGKIDGLSTADLIKTTIASEEEFKIGKASIYSTVEGDIVKEYQIEIVKVDTKNSTNKNFVIKIVDEELLKITNGIVQGMSGSPIVQNGKLIGAVTHVFLNDSTRGFGISIKNMLKG